MIEMALSIGVVRNGNTWKTCMLEQGQLIEQCAFESAETALAYLEHTCARYPELTLAISLACETPFQPLSKLPFPQWESTLTFPLKDWTVQEAKEFLIAIKDINLHSYLVPSPRSLPGIPSYRKLLRTNLGTTNDVCAVAALLYGLREKEAAWPEMQFLLVQINRHSRSVQVLENGCIVNSIATVFETIPAGEQMSIEYELALWEELTRDIAGLMAIHHIEDIVVLGDYQEAFVDHFAEIYQVYLFPSGKADMPGYELALGAAILADGLCLSGRSGEIVEHLQVREASI